MAQHNWVVHKLALHHRRHGDDVYADHCKGYRKPPIFEGPRGGRYRPDVWIPTDGLVYEVEPYLAVERALPQINAFASDERVIECVLVVCSGTDSGIQRFEKLLDRRGVSAYAINFRSLFEELGIQW